MGLKGERDRKDQRVKGRVVSGKEGFQKRKDQPPW